MLSLAAAPQKHLPGGQLARRKPSRALPSLKRLGEAVNSGELASSGFVFPDAEQDSRKSRLKEASLSWVQILERDESGGHVLTACVGHF